jgi:hypothetical protein
MIEMGIVLPLFCCQLGVPKKYCVLLALGNLLLIWVFLVIVRKIQRKDALQWRGTTYESNRYQPTRLDPISSGV